MVQCGDVHAALEAYLRLGRSERALARNQAVQGSGCPQTSSTPSSRSIQRLSRPYRHTRRLAFQPPPDRPPARHGTGIWRPPRTPCGKWRPARAGHWRTSKRPPTRGMATSSGDLRMATNRVAVGATASSAVPGKLGTTSNVGKTPQEHAEIGRKRPGPASKEAAGAGHSGRDQRRPKKSFSESSWPSSRCAHVTTLWLGGR